MTTTRPSDLYWESFAVLVQAVSPDSTAVEVATLERNLGRARGRAALHHLAQQRAATASSTACSPSSTRRPTRRSRSPRSPWKANGSDGSAISRAAQAAPSVSTSRDVTGWPMVLGDRGGEVIEIGAGEVHAAAGAVAVEAVADMEVLLEVVGEREVQERAFGPASSMVVVRPPWTTARSQTDRCR